MGAIKYYFIGVDITKLSRKELEEAYICVIKKLSISSSLPINFKK